MKTEDEYKEVPKIRAHEQQIQDVEVCKDQEIQELEEEPRKWRNNLAPVLLKDLGGKNADDREFIK